MWALIICKQPGKPPHRYIWLCCCSIDRSFATTVSQLKICDFSGETFKGFEVLQFSMSATTTQLLSSGKFCKLRYDTIPVKSASANVSFYTNNSKMPNFELWHSCRKRARYKPPKHIYNMGFVGPDVCAREKLPSWVMSEICCNYFWFYFVFCGSINKDWGARWHSG